MKFTLTDILIDIKLLTINKRKINIKNIKNYYFLFLRLSYNRLTITKIILK